MNQYRDYCKPSNKPPLLYELDETDPMGRGRELEREEEGERGREKERQRQRSLIRNMKDIWSNSIITNYPALLTQTREMC